ncbi:hypothetical protein, partial [Streptomyces sp. NPDC001948]
MTTKASPFQRTTGSRTPSGRPEQLDPAHHAPAALRPVRVGADQAGQPDQRPPQLCHLDRGAQSEPVADTDLPALEVDQVCSATLNPDRLPLRIDRWPTMQDAPA